MLMDINSIFCDKQSIVATTASENTVDVPAYIGRTGRVQWICFMATTNFDELTSIAVKVQESISGVWTDTERQMSLTLAQLNAGPYFFELPRNITGDKIRLYFTITGSNPNNGEMMAFITPTPQEWYPTALMLDGSRTNTYLT